MPSFIKGQKYVRSDLHVQYGGSRQSGISTCPNFKIILIFSGGSGSQYGYHDAWSDDKSRFYYTGEGQIGDMTLTRGNKAIFNHLKNGFELHLFVYVDRGTIVYKDRMACIDIQERFGPDKTGNNRKIIVFTLQPYDDFKAIEHEDLIQSDSWKIISDTIAVKKMDRSSFIHYGTGIPIKIRGFFNLTSIQPGENKQIELLFGDEVYEAKIRVDIQPTPRTQILWHADFESKIKSVLPKWYQHFLDYGGDLPESPEMRFIKLNSPTQYAIEFIEPEKIGSDILSDIDVSEEERIAKEGRIVYYYGKRYERDPENRRIAIEYHGLQCSVCGFDFFQIYGDRGQGFIEVHHIKPISTFKQEIKVNPKTDLFPVCANCHRIIHRKSDNILSIEEMKRIMN